MADALRFAGLVYSFHIFQDAPVWTDMPGKSEVDLRALDAWAHAMDPERSDGVAFAASFLLNCFSSYEKWKCGKFDMFEAMRQWDARHQAAFLAWVCEPWRP